MSSLCSTLKHQYNELKAMKESFVSSCNEAKGTGDSTLLTTGTFDTLTKQDLQKLKYFKLKLETARNELKDRLVVSPEAAREIMGVGSYFGPEAVLVTHGVELNKKDLPSIPWSAQELKEAEARGEMLILRIDKDKDGNPLTAKAMNDYCQPLLDNRGKGKALIDPEFNWYKDDPIYTKELCRSGWALVSKELLPNSTNEDYVQQTRLIIDYITITLLNKKNTAIHPKERKEYQDAIDEFNHYIETTFRGMDDEQINAELRGTSWEKYTKELAALSITQLTHQRFVEAFSDILTVALNTPDPSIGLGVRQRFLDFPYTWTSSRSSSGHLVDFGDQDASAASVLGWNAGHRGFFLGVLFVRRGPASSAGRPGVSR